MTCRVRVCPFLERIEKIRCLRIVGTSVSVCGNYALLYEVCYNSRVVIVGAIISV